MEVLFVLIFGFLIFWVIHITLKKIGIYESFFNSKLMNTEVFKLIIFVFKVYLIPLKGGVNPLKKEYLTAKYFLISISYFGSFWSAVIIGYFLLDSTHRIEQIKNQDYIFIVGKLVNFSKSVARPTQYYLTIEDLSGEEQTIQYFILKDSITHLKGKTIKVNYVKGLFGNKEMVSMLHQETSIKKIEEELDWLLEDHKQLFELQILFILLTLFLPWIRFWQFGLIPFFYWVKK